MSWLVDERGHASRRAKLEISKMKALFNIDKPVRLNYLGWDVPFSVTTLQNPQLHYQDRSDVYWEIHFKMRNLPRSPVGVNPTEPVELKIVYHGDPTNEPHAYIPSHEHLILGEPTPHHFGGGRLCLFDHGQSRALGWDPAKSTASTVAIWSIQWLRTYYYWKKTNNWPTTTGGTNEDF